MRHADAGYETAIECARENGLNLPFLGQWLMAERTDTVAQRAHRHVRRVDDRVRARRAADAWRADRMGGRRKRAAEVSGPAEVRDLGGAWVTPGLIDCHTHLVFAGTRATEYAERLKGRTYAEIARAGGGILSTMRAVRAASDQQLFDESVPRLQALLAEGVTTIEIKSGYGLTLADEGKMLRVARALQRAFPVTVKTTLLAAHTVPPEFKGRADDYIDVDLRGLAAGAARRRAGRCGGRVLRDHRVQCGAVGAAVRCRAGSGPAGKDACRAAVEPRRHARWRRAITRCPATTWNMPRQPTPLPGGRGHRRGVVAGCLLLPCRGAQAADPGISRGGHAGWRIATDCNPGSAPGTSLLLAMSMATRLFGLTAEEALAGVTRNAARALGEQATVAARWPRARPPISSSGISAPSRS